MKKPSHLFGRRVFGLEMPNITENKGRSFRQNSSKTFVFFLHFFLLIYFLLDIGSSFYTWSVSPAKKNGHVNSDGGRGGVLYKKTV